MRGAGYGVVEGAVEAGEDPTIAVTRAIEAAREAAGDMGLESEDSAAILAGGALLAAEACGQEVVDAVKKAIPGRTGKHSRRIP